MMEVEKHVGKIQLVGFGQSAGIAKPLQLHVVNRWRAVAGLRTQRHQIADDPPVWLPDVVYRPFLDDHTDAIKDVLRLWRDLGHHVSPDRHRAAAAAP